MVLPSFRLATTTTASELNVCWCVCVWKDREGFPSGLTQDIKMGSCVFQCDVPHQWIAQRQVGPVSVYCDGVGCHVPWLRHGIPVWQHIGQSVSTTSRHRRDMTSDVFKRRWTQTVMLFDQTHLCIKFWGWDEAWVSEEAYRSPCHHQTPPRILPSFLLQNKSKIMSNSVTLRLLHAGFIWSDIVVCTMGCFLLDTLIYAAWGKLDIKKIWRAENQRGLTHIQYLC